MTVINADQVFVNPAKNQIGIQSVTTTDQHHVGADFITTAHGVNAYADFGAARFVARHYSGNGFEESTAPTLMRASEHHSIRQAGTSGDTWALEVGVHSLVEGDGTQNVGIDLRSGNGGWFAEGVQAARGDIGLRIWGDSGWKFPIKCMHTDMGTNLFSVDQWGNVVIGASLSIPELERLTGDVVGNVLAGNDAKLQNIFHKNITFDHNGAGGGTRIFCQKAGTYELDCILLSTATNAQAFVYYNGTQTSAGAYAAPNTNMHIKHQCTMAVNDFLTVRCTHGGFGNNPAFSHVSMKRIA